MSANKYIPSSIVFDSLTDAGDVHVSSEAPLPIAIITGGGLGGLAGSSDTTESTQFLVKTAVESIVTNTGGLIETVPATDTASSGLNGRLQRIAQRLTSLIALIPTTLGQGTMATSMKVVLPSDQASIPVLSTLSAETTKVIGTVNISSSQTIAAVTAITNALPAGTYLLGKVGIDQTTPGTTNAVVASALTTTNISTSAYVASLVISATSKKLFGLTGYNSNVVAQFIQLHDAATLPADTAVPVVIISVPATSNFSIDFGRNGRNFTTGIIVCNSSTGPTKTIGSADIFVDARVL
jgi:hypothetical protein